MADPRRVAILGGKGGGTLAAQTVLNLSRATGSFALAGYLNDRLPKGSPLYGGDVLGAFDDWRELDADIHFVAPLHKAGHIEANSARVAGLAIPDARWAVLIDPSASVADGVRVGGGSVVAPFATLCPDAAVGNHCFVRAGALVSHDVVIGNSVLVGASVVLSGYCRVETGAHIGPGAVVREEITVGAFSVVGIGTVVTKDVPAHTVVMGNPARVYRKSDKPVSGVAARAPR